MPKDHTLHARTTRYILRYCWLTGLFLLFLRIGCSHAATDSANPEAYRESQDIAASSSAEAPWAEVLENAHHLGKISRHRTYEYTFRLVNAGTAVLEIRKVLPG